MLTSSWSFHICGAPGLRISNEITTAIVSLAKNAGLGFIKPLDGDSATLNQMLQLSWFIKMKAVFVVLHNIWLQTMVDKILF